MKLLEIINIIEKGKETSRLLQAKSGKDFETRMLEHLTDDGTYIIIDKGNWKTQNLEEYRKLKFRIQDMRGEKLRLENELHRGITKGRNVIIKHPFGSQQYPDLLLMTNKWVVPLEIKYSMEKSTKPVWNSGLPRNGGIYIFGNFKFGVTYFMGHHLLSSSERSLLIDIFQKTDNYLEELRKKNEQQLLNTDFSLYLRRMYNQKSSLFDNSKKDREKRTREELTKLDV